MRTAFETEHLGAVVVGVWRDGDPIVVGALGESMTGVPATTDMHHITGNVTTIMLTTVLLQLVDEGELSLDDTLSTWFPDIPSADVVTLDMLAHNTSGYAHFPNSDAFRQAFYADPFAALTPADLVGYVAAEGVAFQPGSDWAFADTNLIMLQMVIEKETGRPMGELMRERIWEPLGMADTTPATSADLREPVLHAYTGERGVWEDSTFWTPTWIQYAGGVGSNQDDLRRFIEAVGSGELLSPESRAKQVAPDTVGMGRFTEDFYYAMGLGVTNDWIFVNPSLQGYSAAVAHLPAEKLTMVIYNTRTQAADQDRLQSSQLFVKLATLLTPDHVPMLPGG